jgi:hypothetical protein
MMMMMMMMMMTTDSLKGKVVPVMFQLSTTP